MTEVDAAMGQYPISAASTAGADAMASGAIAVTADSSQRRNTGSWELPAGSI